MNAHKHLLMHTNTLEVLIYRYTEKLVALEIHNMKVHMTGEKTPVQGTDRTHQNKVYSMFAQLARLFVLGLELKEALF